MTTTTDPNNGGAKSGQTRSGSERADGAKVENPGKTGGHFSNRPNVREDRSCKVTSARPHSRAARASCIERVPAPNNGALSDPNMPRALELYSGHATIAAALRARGWSVLTLDLHMDADVRADARTWHPPHPFDFVWASPPCEEFTRTSLPWHPKFGGSASLEYVEAAMRIRDESACAWWALENVRGSVPFISPTLGEPECCGPVRLWHNFPSFVNVQLAPWKQRISGTRRDLRARMPERLAHAVADIVTDLVHSPFLARSRGGGA